jgi:hypothetical protein
VVMKIILKPSKKIFMMKSCHNKQRNFLVYNK